MNKNIKSILFLIISILIIMGFIIFIICIFKNKLSCVDNDWENAYNVFRDVVITVITIFTVIIGLVSIIGGWVLKKIILEGVETEIKNICDNFRSELSNYKNEIFNDFYNNKNKTFSEFYRRLTELWGRLYSVNKNTIIIDHAIKYGKIAFNQAKELNENDHYDYWIKALNNYLMALVLKGNKDDTTVAYENSIILEQLIK